jgi:hypothetical protein
VEEETGVRDTILGDKLTTTFHVYDEYGKHILKESHWYRMQSPGVQMLEAQASEQITSIEWTDPKRRKELLADCYPLIRDLIVGFA